MNLATITMDPELARQKLKAFRADLHKDTERVYSEAAKAYEVLALGKPLLRLTPAIQAGGFHPDWRPKLAIARADRREVYFRWPAADRFATFDTRRSSQQSNELTVRVDMGRENPKTTTNKNQTWHVSAYGYALVPMVPADVRPATGQLRDWFILWEVDRWFDTSPTTAPVDPVLLQHIAGDLYAILAQWDLTEVERAVLEGAMRGGS